MIKVLTHPSDNKLPSLAEVQRLKIYEGCHNCGRILIKDDEVIEGCFVVYPEGDQIGIPFCVHCLAKERN